MWLNRSSTTVRYSHPTPVGMYMMSADRTVSGDRQVELPGQAVLDHRQAGVRVDRADPPPRGLPPDTVFPHALATALSEHAWPRPANSAAIRGLPYQPQSSAWTT